MLANFEARLAAIWQREQASEEKARSCKPEAPEKALREGATA